jgi:hypothetical protein
LPKPAQFLAPGMPRRLALQAWTSPPPALRAVSCAVMTVRTCFCGMLKSSMFAEMPLDNRTVVQFAAVAAIVGFFRMPDTSPSSKRLKVSSWLAVL